MGSVFCEKKEWKNKIEVKIKIFFIMMFNIYSKINNFKFSQYGVEDFIKSNFNSNTWKNRGVELILVSILIIYVKYFGVKLNLLQLFYKFALIK